jgi:hybrid cluster-associated redox disulfide protein
MDETPRITADMTMAEVLDRYPQVENILVKYRLHCVGCEVSTLETLEVAAQTHKKDLQALLNDLNQALENA